MMYLSEESLIAFFDKCEESQMSAEDILNALYNFLIADIVELKNEKLMQILELGWREIDDLHPGSTVN